MALFVYDKKKGSLIPAEKMPVRRRSCATWPMASETLSCSDAGRVLEEQAELAKQGVKTDYDEEFRPIFTSRSHRKAHMRALKFADPDAGYGDAEPVNWDGNRKPARARQRLNEAREALIAKEYAYFGRRVSDL